MADEHIPMEFYTDDSIPMEFYTDDAMEADLGEVIKTGTNDAPAYAGPYTVIPGVESQTLDTSNKLMQADLIVKEIPYVEVTNLANGKTVTIG